nr:MAG TPA: hypothetical protein [Herelleviridae sp.]
MYTTKPLRRFFCYPIYCIQFNQKFSVKFTLDKSARFLI